MRVNDINYVAFSQLNYGDVFKAKDGSIYIKINLSYYCYNSQYINYCFNAVRVNDGERQYIDETDFVIKLDATLSIGV